MLGSIAMGISAISRGIPYHDQETHSDRLADLDEFALVGYVTYTGQFMKFRVM